MKFNDITYTASLIVLGLTILYIVLYSGLLGLLVTSAVGFIAYALMEPIELVVAVTVLFAFFYVVVLKKYVKRYEGFKNNPADITAQLEKMKQEYKPAKQSLGYPAGCPVGVYNPSIEGFADAGAAATPATATPAEGDGAGSNAAGLSATGGSAPTSSTTNAVSSDQVNKVMAAVTQAATAAAAGTGAAMVGGNANMATATPATTAPTATTIETEEFQSATNGLFKVGKMPSEHEGGAKLDAGQTIMKSMQSMDPSTINNMTMDTKKLLETQQSLMGMLKQMRPVLADGKELLSTFSGLFGGLNGGANASPFKLGK